MQGTLSVELSNHSSEVKAFTIRQQTITRRKFLTRASAGARFIVYSLGIRSASGLGIVVPIVASQAMF